MRFFLCSVVPREMVTDPGDSIAKLGIVLVPSGCREYIDPISLDLSLILEPQKPSGFVSLDPVVF